MSKTALYLLSTAAVGVLAVSDAYAQEVPPATPPAAAQHGVSAAEPDVIIVTARRRAEDASKVPISISTLSTEQLEKAGIANVQDVAKIAPGLAVTTSPAGKGSPFIAIRGQSRAITGNISPGVLVYLNDVPLQNFGSIIQTYDMADVQVLKGPQGTLFGRNALGGAILTNSKAPSYTFEGYVRGEIAQYDTQSIEGAINLPILADHIALRVAGRMGKDGTAVNGTVYNGYSLALGPTGFVATPGPQVPNPRLKPGEFLDQSFRASLLLEPTDWIKNVSVYTYAKSRGMPAPLVSKVYSNGVMNDGQNLAIFFQPPAQIATQFTPIFGPAGAAAYASIVQQLAQCPAGTINCNIFVAKSAMEGTAITQRISAVNQDPGLARFIFNSFSNTTTIDISSNHRIKNIFGYNTIDNVAFATLSGTPIPTITTAQAYQMKQLTEELQLSGDFFGKSLQYTVGGFYFREDPNGPGGFGLLENNAFFGLSHSISANYLHNRSKAIYGQVNYSPEWLLKGINFTAGLRQTWDKQSTCTTLQQFSPFATGFAMQIRSAGDLSGAVPNEAACDANSGLAPGAGSLPAGVTSQLLPYRSFSKLTYTLGANWQVSRDAMVYVARRRGYRQGGYNNPLFDPFLSSVQAFEPETVTDWEIGTKLKWRGNGMSGALNIALYSGKDIGNQLPTSTAGLGGGTCVPSAVGSAGRAANCTTNATQTAFAVGTPGVLIRQNGTTVILNARDLTIRGFDIDAVFSPVHWLTFNGGVGYVDVTIDKSAADANLNALYAAAGRPPVDTSSRIQGQPTWTANGGITAQYPRNVLGGTLMGSLSYTYSSSYQQADVIIPGSKSADARVSLDEIGGTGLSLAVWVRNITDEIVYQGGAGTSPQALGINSFLVGMPRTIGVTGTFKF